MVFYALAYKKEPGAFYNFNLGDWDYNLNNRCLLPSKDMAQRFKPSEDYEVLRIVLKKYSEEKNKMVYLFVKPKEWA